MNEMSSKKKIAIICCVSMLAFLCAGCGKKETTQPETNQVEETVEEQTEAETEKVEEEVVEETQAEEVDPMEEWLTNLGLQGVYVAVWNDSNSTQHIMEEGEMYTKNEGDRFFICTPSFMTEINSSTNNGIEFETSTRENYCEIFFNDSDRDNDIQLAITCKNGETGNISFSLSAPTKEVEETGYEWAKSLGYDEPKMVVWNDTTGLRKELEEGETYQLCEGDEVALYMTANYLFDSANVDESLVARGINVAVLSWKKIELGDKFDFEITIYHTETYDTITLHVTLLPPIE